MKSSSRTAARTTARLYAVIGACVVMATGLTACGGAEREYAVPKSLCGIAVPADELAPFLPAGKEIEVKERDSDDELSWKTGCLVLVDGKDVLATTVEWNEPDTRTGDFAGGVSLERPDHSTDDGHFLWSGREGFGRTGCTAPDDGDRLFTAVRAYGSEHEDADAMKRVIHAYTKAVEKSDLCRSAGEL
ncbi:hypothetical protein [Streptomyces sp. UH6]|uniref:hypothetical protein n=1 Tax=Streptomyces sp. UH6 TaxID=2748379 RepID=UPI0015D4DC15|nr:hypothetical protein [Streptomyces sp. UH6]NYV74308.1 hypothetical protein [Streptomyces sp. UH6]